MLIPSLGDITTYYCVQYASWRVHYTLITPFIRNEAFQYETITQTVTPSIVSCFQRQCLIQKTSLLSDYVYYKTILTEF